MDFNRATALLSNPQPHGYTLYDHIIELVAALKENPNADLEPLSKSILKEQLESAKYYGNTEFPTISNDEKYESLQKHHVSRNISLYQNIGNLIGSSPFPSVEPKPAELDENGEPVEEKQPQQFSPSDILRYKDKVKEAGIGLTDVECVNAVTSLEKLSSRENLERIVLFGKFLTIADPYYIAKSEYVQKDKRSPTLPYTFWFSSGQQWDWKPLPHIEDKEIDMARKIHKYLTGTPSFTFYGPGFKISEIKYLTAQILRIHASTSISPSGYFMEAPEDEQEDEDPEEEQSVSKEKVKEPCVVNPDFTSENIEDWKDPTSWVHHTKNIPEYKPPKKIVEKNEDENEEEEEEEEGEGEEDGGVENIPLLNSVSEDKEFFVRSSPKIEYEKTEKNEEENQDDDDNDGDDEEEENEEDGNDANSSKNVIPSWKIEMNGDVNQYAILHSLRWPGAITVGGNTGSKVWFFNFYVGFGLKSLPEPYTPPLPPTVLSEAAPIYEINDPAVRIEKKLLEGSEIDQEEEEENQSEDEDNDEDNDEEEEEEDNEDDE